MVKLALKLQDPSDPGPLLLFPISFSKIDLKNEHLLGKRILLKNQEILHLMEYINLMVNSMLE